MLFESRRILLGFRIKILFESSLRMENSYVFVNISKTQNIKDLVDNIKQRFKIQEDICITLNDCPLLESEDILVLNDVIEVKIVPVLNKSGNNSKDLCVEKRALVLNPASNDSLKLTDNVQTVVRNHILPPTGKDGEKNDEPKVFQDYNRPVIMRNRKRKPYYGSIAETLKYLSQRPTEDELDSSYPVSDHLNFVNDNEDSGRQKMNEEKDGKIVESQLSLENDVSFDEAGGAFFEKGRRKRKRRHSKKPKFEPEDPIEVSKDDLKKKKEFNFKITDELAPRQHIFFQDENDCREAEEGEHENMSIVDQSLCEIKSSSADPAEPVTNGATGLSEKEDTSETVTGDYPMDTESNTSITEALKTNNNDQKRSFLEDKNPTALQSSNSENTNSLARKQLAASVKPTFISTKIVSQNNFSRRFDSGKPNECQNYNKPVRDSDSGDPLATLLMCKQLQTPVEYNVQFTSSNSQSRSRSNSSCNITQVTYENIEKTKTDLVRVNGAGNKDGTKCTRDESECEVLRHYKILDSQIFLSDSNETWNILSAKDASLKLQPVKEPYENQSITFQILYLSQDLCPKMSNLMCGKVISFNKDNEKVTLSVPPAFINSLLKDCGEDACLPEELLWITDNVYEISWMAVKNPRLLM